MVVVYWIHQGSSYMSFLQNMIVVVKTNIDITFANNRCFDLSLAEFMTFIILSYEMSVV